MRELLSRLKGKVNPRLMLLSALLLAACALLSPALQGADAGMTREEKRLAGTLSGIAGAGAVRVTIYYAQASSAFSGGAQAPTGALVVAQGADDIAVRLDLAAAVQALLSLPPESVRVFDMEESP